MHFGFGSGLLVIVVLPSFVHSFLLLCLSVPLYLTDTIECNVVDANDEITYAPDPESKRARVCTVFCRASSTAH